MRGSLTRAINALVLTAAIVTAGLPVATAAARPDLQVTTLSALPEAGQGGRLPITSKVSNKGAGKAGASSLGFFLSTDAKRGNDIRLKPARKVKALAARASSRATTNTTVPASAPLGEYRVIACADVAKAVAESNEKNNCRTAVGSVTIGPPPTAVDLIEQDEADGRITAEEALTYEVFANFEDPRLPERYAGAPPETFGHSALEEAQMKWESLSTETQDILEPFLVPAYHLGSHWTPPLVARSSQTEGDAGEPWACASAPVPTSQDWRFLDVPGAPVRIWWQLRYDETDNEAATELASFVPTAYEAVTDYMGREPVADGGGFCDGGSDAFDIALVDSGTATTVSDGLVCGTPDSSHMFWPRNPPSDWAHPAPYLAHEFMHAVQFAVDTDSGCSEYAWLREATAQWMQDYVTDGSYGINLPGDDSEQLAAKLLMKYPEAPLEQLSPPKSHPYGAYLLFLYASRAQAGGIGVVREVWDATIGNNSLDAVESALDGGFSETWRKFALANWNNGPISDYKDWDGLSTGAAVSGAGHVPVGKITPSIEVDHLSTWYVELTYAEKVAEVEYVNDQAGDPDAHVQSIIYYDDGSYDVKNLSQNEKTVLCLNDGTKKATRVVIVYSNASKTAPATFSPEIEGKKECGCPNETQEASQRFQDGGGVCVGEGNFQFSWTDNYSNEDWNVQEQGSGNAQLNMVATQSDPDSYESQGGTYSVQVNIHSELYRHNHGDTNCLDEIADISDSGSGTLEDGAVGGLVHQEDEGSPEEFWLGPIVMETRRVFDNEVVCVGPQHDEYDSFVTTPECPFSSTEWNFYYKFTKDGGPDSKTYTLSCSNSETWIDGNGREHNTTVNVSGTITLIQRRN